MTKPIYVDTQDLVLHAKLETSLSSLANRRGDLIQFTTLDDVKVELSQDLFKESATMDPITGTISYVCSRVASAGDPHILIPAKTPIYGTVSSRKSRSPFWIGGKAKVYARLATDPLPANDVEYSPMFDDPEQFENLEPCKKAHRKKWREYRTARQAALDENRGVLHAAIPPDFQDIEMCIKGRRAQIDWATAILGPLVAGYATVVDFNADDEGEDDGVDIPAALTSAAILGKASGLSDVLSGTSATIPAGMIFRIKLVKRH